MSASRDDWQLTGIFEMAAWQVASVVTRIGLHATVTPAIGVWDRVEPAVSIHIQANTAEVELLLDALAEAFPFLNDIHVEYHPVQTQYVSLELRR